MVLRFQLLILFLTLAAPSVGDAAGEIHLGGTDLLAEVMDFYAEVPAASDFNRVTVAMEGTLPALDALEAGKLDMALILDTPMQDRDLSLYTRLPAGYMILQVLVHENNPLESIRVNRLAGIFGESEDFDFYHWGDLGVEDWADRTIHPFAVAVESGVEVEYFRHRVLDVPRFKRNVTFADSPANLLDTIRSEQSAIGLAGFIDGELEGVRVLPLTSGTSEVAVPPIPKNVYSGTYPLQVPLVLLYNKSRLPVLRRILANFYTEAFAEQLEAAGYMPVPEKGRHSIRRNFE